MENLNSGKDIKKSEMENKKGETSTLLTNVKHLLECLQEHKLHDDGLKFYKRIIKASLKSKGNKLKTVLEAHGKVFIKLFEEYKENILDGNFEWLCNNDIVLSFEDNKKCSIPISAVYCKLLDNNNDQDAAQIEALLCRCISSSLKNSEDKLSMEKICNEYIITPSNNALSDTEKLLGRIIDKTQSKLDPQSMQNNDMMSAIGPVIEAFTKDNEIQESMELIYQNVSSGQLSIPEIFMTFANKFNFGKN